VLKEVPQRVIRPLILNTSSISPIAKERQVRLSDRSKAMISMISKILGRIKAKRVSLHPKEESFHPNS
jgi:hypothetical protein